MIIENGTLQIQRTKTDWGEPILCQIRTNKLDNLGKSNGNSFTAASYVILIEMQPFDAKAIRLMREDICLGEFPIISTEPLPAVGIIKILV